MKIINKWFREAFKEDEFSLYTSIEETSFGFELVHSEKHLPSIKKQLSVFLFEGEKQVLSMSELEDRLDKDLKKIRIQLDEIFIEEANHIKEEIGNYCDITSYNHLRKTFFIFCDQTPYHRLAAEVFVFMNLPLQSKTLKRIKGFLNDYGRLGYWSERYHYLDLEQRIFSWEPPRKRKQKPDKLYEPVWWVYLQLYRLFQGFNLAYEIQKVFADIKEKTTIREHPAFVERSDKINEKVTLELGSEINGFIRKFCMEWYGVVKHVTPLLDFIGIDEKKKNRRAFRCVLKFNSVLEILWYHIGKTLCESDTGICPKCGAIFKSNRPRIYCGDECKWKAYQERYYKRPGVKQRKIEQQRERRETKKRLITTRT